ncbi:MAG: family 43 glycosylhydrolase [Gemmatimonadota bacterium]
MTRTHDDGPQSQFEAAAVLARANTIRAAARAAAPSGAVLALVLLTTAPVGAQTGVTTEDVPIHDPVLIEADGAFYLFGTGRGIDVWASDDLEQWRQLPRVFAETPAWVFEILPEFDGSMWAPDIYEHDGTFYLYYSVSAFGRNNSAIGVATTPALDPDDPDFGWTDHGPVVQSVPGRDLWNAIDAHVVHDGAGEPWMSFGSHWGGIKLLRLDPTLTRPAETPAWSTIAARHRYWKLDERDAGDAANPELDYGTLYPDRITELNRASESGAIEAPVIFRRGDHYYLFVSWDRCCRGVNSTYKVVVGRSPDITGPYLDRAGQELVWGGGSLVTYGFDDSDRWAAGGHNDAVTIDGTDYLVFHAYDETDNGRSKLLIREITWDDWGWPTVAVDAP